MPNSDSQKSQPTSQQLNKRQLIKAYLKVLLCETPEQLDKQQPNRRPRREYGIGDFLSYIHSDGGIRNAARRVQVEEKIGRVLSPRDTAQLELFDKMKLEDLKFKM